MCNLIVKTVSYECDFLITLPQHYTVFILFTKLCHMIMPSLHFKEKYFVCIEVSTRYWPLLLGRNGNIPYHLSRRLEIEASCTPCQPFTQPPPPSFISTWTALWISVCGKKEHWKQKGKWVNGSENWKGQGHWKEQLTTEQFQEVLCQREEQSSDLETGESLH